MANIVVVGAVAREFNDSLKCAGNEASYLPYLKAFVQTHVILTILRVCWGGSVLQSLTPDLVNPVMNSKLSENNLFSKLERVLTPSKSPSAASSDEFLIARSSSVFTVKASPDPLPKPPFVESGDEFLIVRKPHVFNVKARSVLQPKAASLCWP